MNQPTDTPAKLEKLPWYRWHWDSDVVIVYALLGFILYYGLHSSPAAVDNKQVIWFGLGFFTALASVRFWQSVKKYRTPFTKTLLTKKQAHLWLNHTSNS